jgi:hypothetical protein
MSRRTIKTDDATTTTTTATAAAAAAAGAGLGLSLKTGLTLKKADDLPSKRMLEVFRGRHNHTPGRFSHTRSCCFNNYLHLKQHELAFVIHDNYCLHCFHSLLQIIIYSFLPFLIR